MVEYQHIVLVSTLKLMCTELNQNKTACALILYIQNWSQASCIHVNPLITMYNLMTGQTTVKIEFYLENHFGIICFHETWMLYELIYNFSTIFKLVFNFCLKILNRFLSILKYQTCRTQNGWRCCVLGFTPCLLNSSLSTPTYVYIYASK